MLKKTKEAKHTIFNCMYGQAFPEKKGMFFVSPGFSRQGVKVPSPDIFDAYRPKT